MKRVLSVVFVLAILMPGIVSATPDKTLMIQVYQLCDDSGSSCVSLGPAGDNFFATETNQIWAQAGISVNFNFAGSINSTLFSTIDDASSNHSFWALQMAYGHDDFLNNVVDMFLVHGIDNKSAYGEGWSGYAGLVMDMDFIMSYNGGGG